MLLTGVGFGGMFALVSMVFGLVGGFMAYQIVKSMTDKTIMRIIAFILGFTMFVPGIIIAVIICVATGSVKDGLKDQTLQDKKHFDDIDVPDGTTTKYVMSDQVNEAFERIRRERAELNRTGNTTNPHTHEDKKILVEDLDKEVKRGSISRSTTADSDNSFENKGDFSYGTSSYSYGTDSYSYGTDSYSYGTGSYSYSKDSNGSDLGSYSYDQDSHASDLSTYSDSSDSAMDKLYDQYCGDKNDENVGAMDKLYNQYCGDETDENRKEQFKQDDYQSYLNSETAEVSAEAKKEYVESLKSKLEMGMISKDEYKRMIKRYR